MNTDRSELFRHDQSQRGVSLIELLIVIVVIGMMAAGVLIGGKKAFTGGDVNLAADSITMLAANIKSAYPTGNYTGLSTTTVITAKLAPESLINGASLRNEFGGSVAINTYVLFGSGYADAFEIAYMDVPSDACTELVARLGLSFDFVNLYTGPGAGTFIMQPLTPTQRVLDRGAVASACGVDAFTRVSFFKA